MQGVCGSKHLTLLLPQRGKITLKWTNDVCYYRIRSISTRKESFIDGKCDSFTKCRWINQWQIHNLLHIETDVLFAQIKIRKWQDCSGFLLKCWWEVKMRSIRLPFSKMAMWTRTLIIAKWNGNTNTPASWFILQLSDMAIIQMEKTSQYLFSMQRFKEIETNTLWIRIRPMLVGFNWKCTNASLVFYLLWIRACSIRVAFQIVCSSISHYIMLRNKEIWTEHVCSNVLCTCKMFNRMPLITSKLQLNYPLTCDTHKIRNRLCIDNVIQAQNRHNRKKEAMNTLCILGENWSRGKHNTLTKMYYCARRPGCIQCTDAKSWAHTHTLHCH